MPAGIRRQNNLVRWFNIAQQNPPHENETPPVPRFSLDWIRMTLSRLSLLQCQACKNRDGGLLFCPNCGREYPDTTLPGLLLNASLAIVGFLLAHSRAKWSHFLDFVGFQAKFPLGKRILATRRSRKSLSP